MVSLFYFLELFSSEMIISCYLVVATKINMTVGLHADEKSGWIFQRSGELWLNNNLIMQAWEYGSGGEQAGMKGWDVIQVNGEGKVKELYAMIEGVSTHAHGA